MSYPDGFSNVPRPVYGHGLVFIATGFNEPSLLAVRADGKGDVTRTHVAWTLRRGAPLTPSPLLVGDLLYIVSDIGIATVPRREDRRGALAAAAGRQLLRVADFRRWPNLLPQRGRRGDGDRAGHDIPEAGDERARWRDARLDGGIGPLDLHPQRHPPVSDREPPAGAAQQPATDVQTIFDRAVADFVNGRIAESVTGFDNVAKLAPDSAPQLWQRGIALYYAGRYGDCREQFESHRLVNPNDVENAAWHFLCVARAESPAEARTALLPVGPDPRVPMRQIYAMLRDSSGPKRFWRLRAISRKRCSSRTLSGVVFRSAREQSACPRAHHRRSRGPVMRRSEATCTRWRACISGILKGGK